MTRTVKNYRFMTVFAMKKLRKFSLQLPGRKHSAAIQNENWIEIGTPISKAQRILGKESINLNIGPPGNSTLYQERHDESVKRPPKTFGFRQGIFADNRTVEQYATVPISDMSRKDDAFTPSNFAVNSNHGGGFYTPNGSSMTPQQEYSNSPSPVPVLKKEQVKLVHIRPVIHVAKCVSDSFLESHKRFPAICMSKATGKKLRPVSNKSYDDRPVTSASWIETQAFRMNSLADPRPSFERAELGRLQLAEPDTSKSLTDISHRDQNNFFPSSLPETAQASFDMGRSRQNLDFDDKRPEPCSNVSDGSIPIYLASSQASSPRHLSTDSSADLTEMSILSLAVDSDDEGSDSYPVYLKSIKTSTPAIQQTQRNTSPKFPEFLDVRSMKEYENSCSSPDQFDNQTPDIAQDRKNQDLFHSKESFDSSFYPHQASNPRYPNFAQGPPSPPSSIEYYPSPQTCRIMSVTEEERAFVEALRLQKLHMQGGQTKENGPAANFCRYPIAI